MDWSFSLHQEGASSISIPGSMTAPQVNGCSFHRLMMDITLGADHAECAYTYNTWQTTLQIGMLSTTLAERVRTS